MLLESFQMFPIFLSNKKCRLEHVVNKLMSCLITEFLWIFSYKLHGILSNSMDTLWHSMELHRYFREPHGIPWNSTIFHGISWHSMELHHYFMELRGTPWHSMELHGYSMELHGIPWNSMDTPWKFRGIPWISIYFHGIPWISIDFHGFPWNSMEVFHTGLSQNMVSSSQPVQQIRGCKLTPREIYINTELVLS